VFFPGRKKKLLGRNGDQAKLKGQTLRFRKRNERTLLITWMIFERNLLVPQQGQKGLDQK